MDHGAVVSKKKFDPPVLDPLVANMVSKGMTLAYKPLPTPDPTKPTYHGINEQNIPVTLAYPSVAELFNAYPDLALLNFRVVKTLGGKTEILKPEEVAQILKVARLLKL